MLDIYMIAGRFAIYVVCLAVLPLISTQKSKLLYLHGMSVFYLLFVEDKIRVLILIGMLHSIIHNIWPFLGSNGYDKRQPVFYDVFCHFVMMFIGYYAVRQHQEEWLAVNPTNWTTFNLLSLAFLVFSLVNCISAAIIDQQKLKAARYPITWQPKGDSVFVYTSFSQAISTGYWVAICMFYDNLGDTNFLWLWLFTILVKSLHWVGYFNNEKLLIDAAHHKYIEGVFIVCTWVGAIVY